MTAADARRSGDAGPIDSLAEFWDREPDDVWVPEGLTFKVGDRVRIRLSGECAWRGDGVHPTTGALVTKANPHWREIDGLTAVVDEADPTGCTDGHWIHVMLEEPPHITGVGRLVGTAMSFGELVPLDDAGAGGGEGTEP